MTKLCKILLIAILSAFSALSAFTLDVQKDIVEKSLRYVGTPYKTGGTAPPVFDCSGFVGFILKPHVPGMPRVSRDMAKTYPAIQKSQLEPGDIVFFSTSMISGAVTHVALYIGDGKIIHAISDGPETGVVVTDLERKYWKNHYHSSARVLTGAKSPAKPAAPKVETPKAESPKAEPAKAETARAADAKSAPAGAKPAEAKPVAEAKPASGSKQSSKAASSAKEASPAKAGAAVEPSPWDTWEGYIEGDYALWKAEEKAKFGEAKAAYDESSEKDSFEAWKQGKN